MSGLLLMVILRGNCTARTSGASSPRKAGEFAPTTRVLQFVRALYLAQAVGTQ